MILQTRYTSGQNERDDMEMRPRSIALLAFDTPSLLVHKPKSVAVPCAKLAVHRN